MAVEIRTADGWRPGLLVFDPGPNWARSRAAPAGGCAPRPSGRMAAPCCSFPASRTAQCCWTGSTRHERPVADRGPLLAVAPIDAAVDDQIVRRGGVAIRQPGCEMAF